MNDTKLKTDTEYSFNIMTKSRENSIFHIMMYVFAHVVTQMEQVRETC